MSIKLPLWPLAIALLTACAGDAPALTSNESVIPLVFFAEADGSPMTADSPEDTVVYKATSTGPAPIADTDGSVLTLGEARTAAGKVTLTCTGSSTRVQVDASGLRPEGVYTAWVGLFAEPGFAAAGFDAFRGMSPAGSVDGSESAFTAGMEGHGSLDALTPVGPVTVPFVAGTEIPGCLLDAYEVHVVLAYHPDGLTCGETPCGESDYLEHVAWMFGEGAAL